MAPLGLSFATVDVFTTARFKGNPLAIVQVPKSTRLDQETKQAIAKEFNYSETVFLHEPDSPDSAQWRIDIFTVDEELPLAGHPLIGTASWIGQQHPHLEEGTFIAKAGPVKIKWTTEEGIRYAAAEIPHAVNVHREPLRREEVLRLQPKLASAKWELEPFFPLVSIVKGMTFALVELDSLDALDAVRTTTSSIAAKLDREWQPSFVGMYFYVHDHGHDGSLSKSQWLDCRMVEGSIEDPATGSAACTLAAYLALKASADPETQRVDHAFELTQGEKMGRRSEIRVDVAMSSSSKIESVTLRGTAVSVMMGTL